MKKELKQIKKFIKQLKKVNKSTSITEKYVLFDLNLKIKEVFDAEEFIHKRKYKNKTYKILDDDVSEFIYKKVETLDITEEILYRTYYLGGISKAFYIQLKPIYRGKNFDKVGYLLEFTDNTERLKDYSRIVDKYENKKIELNNFKKILMETINELTETKYNFSELDKKFHTLLSENESIRTSLNDNKKELVYLQSRFNRLSNADKLIENILDRLYKLGFQTIKVRNSESNIRNLLESQEDLMLDFPNNMENFNLNADEINRVLESEDSEVDSTFSELLNNIKKFEEDIIFLQNNFYKVKEEILKILSEFSPLVEDVHEVEKYIHKLSNLIENL